LGKYFNSGLVKVGIPVNNPTGKGEFFLEIMALQSKPSGNALLKGSGFNSIYDLNSKVQIETL